MLLLNEVMYVFRPEAVIHLAASIHVEESVRDPLKFYNNIVYNTLNLLEAMKFANVKIFSLFFKRGCVRNPGHYSDRRDCGNKAYQPLRSEKEMTERILRDVVLPRIFITLPSGISMSPEPMQTANSDRTMLNRPI